MFPTQGRHVANAPWRVRSELWLNLGGKGDILKEFAAAARAAGIKIWLVQQLTGSCWVQLECAQCMSCFTRLLSAAAAHVLGSIDHVQVSTRMPEMPRRLRSQLLHRAERQRVRSHTPLQWPRRNTCSSRFALRRLHHHSLTGSAVHSLQVDALAELHVGALLGRTGLPPGHAGISLHRFNFAASRNTHSFLMSCQCCPQRLPTDDGLSSVRLVAWGVRGACVKPRLWPGPPVGCHQDQQ